MLEFKETVDHSDKPYPPGSTLMYSHQDPELDPLFRRSYWFGRLALDLANEPESVPVLERYPWLLQDSRFQSDMAEFAECIGENIQSNHMVMKVAEVLDTYDVLGAQDLERLAIKASMARDFSRYELMYDGLIDDVIASAEAYKLVTYGFGAKHLASTAATYGQIYEKYPELVEEFMPIFSRYFHELALAAPMTVSLAWWIQSYGPGLETSVDARWLTEEQRADFLDRANAPALDNGDDFLAEEERERVLEAIFKGTGLLAAG